MKVLEKTYVKEADKVEKWSSGQQEGMLIVITTHRKESLKHFVSAMS